MLNFCTRKVKGSIDIGTTRYDKDRTWLKRGLGLGLEFRFSVRSLFSRTFLVALLLLTAIPAEARRKPKCPDKLVDGGKPTAVPTRKLEDIKVFTLIAYNLLNLEKHVGKFQWDATRFGFYTKLKEPQTKDERFRREQGDILREVGADVGIFEEVEHRAALEQFFGENTGGLYRTHLKEGNDERGIDIGFGVKLDLPLEVEHRTNKEMTWFDTVAEEERRLFSRDLPVLIFRVKGDPKPVLIVLGTHYKSKRDRGDDDPESRILRKAQVAGTVKIIQDLQREFGKGAPIIFGGDANGNVNKEAEFALLKKALALEDVFDVVSPPLTREQRITHTFHPEDEPVSMDQLDVLMVTPSLRACVKAAYVYRYKDENGKVKPLPRTMKMRKKNPSDHFPVVLTLDFQCVLRIWSAR